jgi:hypothetical protein
MSVGLYDMPDPSGDDRYAIYVFPPRGASMGGLVQAPERRRVYETSLSGIGQGIAMLYEEDEIPRGWRVAVLDRLTRRWIVNPFV